jgi:glycosyltransferase involved in cell wall biosynthesis
MTDLRSYAHKRDFEATIHSLDFEVAFLWVQRDNLDTARWVIEKLRAAGKKQPIIVGGPAVSAGRFLNFPGCNAALFGEPEVGFDRVLERAFVASPEAPEAVDVMGTPFPDLDQLPDPDTGIADAGYEKSCNFFPLFKPPLYTTTIGRSCPACYDSDFLGTGFRCVQCNPEDIQAARRLPRTKSPEKFTDDIYRLSTSHGTGGVGAIVVHDGFIATVKWLEKFISEWRGLVKRIPLFFPLNPEVVMESPLIVRELAKLGMIMTSIDIGSAAEPGRTVLGVARPFKVDEYAIQIITANRVNLSLAYQVGLPEETESKTDEMEAFLRRIPIHYHRSRYFRPTPGHRAFVHCLQKNLLTGLRPGTMPELPVPCLKGTDHERNVRRMISWRENYRAQAVFLPWETAIASPPEIPVPPKTQAFQRPSAPGAPAPNADRVRLMHDQCDALMLRAKKRKVTCVLLSYNRPEYLKEAFHSLEAQTLPKDQWECVLIDNGSTNPRVHEFVDYKNNPTAFPNVRVIKHAHNFNNVATAWNEALAIADGEYFCMLDDDNRKRPEFMEKLVKYLDEHPEVDGAHCRSLVIDKQGQARGERGRTGNFTLEKELEGNFVDSGELMFRVEATKRIGVFDERCKACEDWDFVCRLVHFGKGLGFVDEQLTEYRAHDANRLHTSIELGATACTELLRSKHKSPKGDKLDLKVITPPFAELTQSQKQVISGIREALAKVPFIRMPSYGHDEFNCDWLLVVAPFRYGQPVIDGIRRRVEQTQPKPTVITLHMEDPQAMSSNMRFVGWADWVVANDINAMDHYRQKLRTQSDTVRERQVLCWNSLGLSETGKGIVAEASGGDRPWDVTFFGYPYPSRAKFVREFAKAMPTTWKCLAVGDGWDQVLAGFPKVQTKPTQDERESIRLLCATKIVVTTHRSGEDIGGFPEIRPASIHRGFIEAACGCAVVLDEARTFGHGRVQFTLSKDPMDAVKKTWGLLKTPGKLAEFARHNSAIALQDCSMLGRVTRVLNAVRSQHWNAVIR